MTSGRLAPVELKINDNYFGNVPENSEFCGAQRLIMKKILFTLACLVALAACNTQPDPIEAKLDSYATVEIGTTSLNGISDNGKQVLDYFKLICREVDNIYWIQSFGDKAAMDALPTEPLRAFAQLNYGPWDRLDGQSFVEGYGERPLGANFYPADMTDEEFEALQDPDKYSPYTMIRRAADGSLEVVWYHDAFKDQIERMSNYLHAAADYTIVPSVRNYLLAKIDALHTDNYFDSDVAWLNVTDSKMDLVLGPNLTKDDRLYGIKTSYEAYVLLKDLDLTGTLKEYSLMLPELQKALPCPDEYKTFVPSAASNIYAYNALCYAGAANAGIKKIAVTLPYDPKAQAVAGTHTALLSNVIDYKFIKIVKPAGRLLLESGQAAYLHEGAFFWNIAFRELAHGLGVKETTSGQNVVEALGNEALTLEELKGNTVGLFLNLHLIDKGLVDANVSREKAITTFIASTIRSSRFGDSEALGRANIVCYNYLSEQGAFVRGADGRYVIDYDKAGAAVTSLAGKVLELQAKGDRAAAEQFISGYVGISESLAKDLDAMADAGIPTDIRFQFVW